MTTSTVTVPLVTLGLCLASTIPGRNSVIDEFGVIAFASLFPMMSVLACRQISAGAASIGRKENEMRFKLIMDLVDDHHTENILNAARKAGTAVVKSAHGEGSHRRKHSLTRDRRAPRPYVFSSNARPEVLETIAKAESSTKNLGVASHSNCDLRF